MKSISFFGRIGLVALISVSTSMAASLSDPWTPEQTAAKAALDASYASASVPDTNAPPVISGPGWDAFQFLTSSGSNWMVATYGIYDMGTKEVGGGIGAGYRLSEFFIPTMRVDYLADRVWMPSASIQLQAPLRLMGKLDLVPFVFSGIATPISGRDEDNWDIQGIFGIGAAIRINEHWDIIGDYEKWGGFEGEQIRAGILYKF